MSDSRTYQTQAVILKRTKLGEADRILILYTPHGKTKAIAKGAARPGSKFGGHVEMLTHSQFLLARGKNFNIVTQVQTIDSFMPLKENLKLMTAGLYLSELVNAFTEEDLEEGGLFELLLETLQQLTAARNVESVLRYFELHILEHAGYKPQLGNCVACGRTLQPETNCFSAAQGGVLCVNCSFEEPVTQPLSLNALKVLRLWQKCDFISAQKVQINDTLALELELTLREYIRYILERQIKSTDFIDKLKLSP
jgi:DNA repair protein RecO (recombination protein O)